MAFEDRSLPGQAVPEIHLCIANADQTADVLEALPGATRPGYTIGQWAWETDTVPPRWDPVFKLVDEIWVNSTWVAETIARSSPVPVVVVPQPVEAPEPDGAELPVELPDGYRFLFAFDFYSTTSRKNPVGLVNAFTRAFRPNEGPVLVLKTINGMRRPDERALVQYAIGGRSDVVIVDMEFSERQHAALFAACDCYVSLHRAEGFGMTIAEAMALGKPVIATAWSGNMDFTTAHNSYLVDYQLRTVGPDNPPYNPEGTWAEPSIDHAVRAHAPRLGAPGRGQRPRGPREAGCDAAVEPRGRRRAGACPAAADRGADARGPRRWLAGGGVGLARS